MKKDKSKKLLQPSEPAMTFPMTINTEYDYTVLKASIEKRLRTSFEADYAARLNEVTKRLEDEMKVTVQKQFSDWRAEQEQKVLSTEDIQTLLDQEYAEFQLQIQCQNTDSDEVGDRTYRTFTLRELPQSSEKKFVDLLTTKLRPYIKDIAEVTTRLAEGNLEAKFENIMNMIGPSFDIMAEAVAIVLNPFGKWKDIDIKWVQENVSTNRQWSILQAQEKLNNLRNFISLASLVSLGKVG